MADENPPAISICDDDPLARFAIRRIAEDVGLVVDREGSWDEIGDDVARWVVPAFVVIDGREDRALADLTLRAVAMLVLVPRDPGVALVRWWLGRDESSEPAACALVLRDEHDTDTLAEVMRLLARGYSLTSPAARRTLNGPAAFVSAIATLTDRQYEVAHMVAGGMKNREIAQRLSVSESTVKAHVADAMRSLSVARRIDLAAAMMSFNGRAPDTEHGSSGRRATLHRRAAVPARGPS